MAVAAGLLPRLCACRPYDVFFVRAYYVHASHATSSCLGLYFSRIPCSVSFAILRLPFCSFCSLTLSALCSSVGVTSTRPPLMPYLMCAFPYLPLSVLVMPTSVFLCGTFVPWIPFCWYRTEAKAVVVPGLKLRFAKLGEEAQCRTVF